MQGLRREVYQPNAQTLRAQGSLLTCFKAQPLTTTRRTVSNPSTPTLSVLVVQFLRGTVEKEDTVPALGFCNSLDVGLLEAFDRASLNIATISWLPGICSRTTTRTMSGISTHDVVTVPT
eukprot:5133275-Amphidinium_carterae.1